MGHPNGDGEKRHICLSYLMVTVKNIKFCDIWDVISISVFRKGTKQPISHPHVFSERHLDLHKLLGQMEKMEKMVTYKWF